MASTGNEITGTNGAKPTNQAYKPEESCYERDSLVMILFQICKGNQKNLNKVIEGPYTESNQTPIHVRRRTIYLYYAAAILFMFVLKSATATMTVAKNIVYFNAWYAAIQP